MKGRTVAAALLALSCVAVTRFLGGDSPFLVPAQPAGLSIAVYRRAHDRGIGPIYFARTLRVPARRIPAVARLANSMRHITSPTQVAISCSPFRQFWYDILTFTYPDRKPVRLRVYAGCPYIAREGDVIAGADEPWARLNYLIDRILGRRSSYSG